MAKKKVGLSPPLIIIYHIINKLLFFSKDHLKNYFNYLFTLANDYINKNVN